LKEKFSVLVEEGSFEPEEVDTVQFSRRRRLSNEELMQTHQEFGLATWDPENDGYNKEALVLFWIQTFYSEAVIKLKETSKRFKNLSPSNILLKMR